MNKPTAVTIGDINGIGIEILIDLFKNNKIKNFVLFSDVKAIRKYLNKKNYKINLNIINNNKKKSINLKKKYFNIFTYSSKSLEDNTLKSIIFAHKYCKENKFAGMVTLPIRKDLIIKKLIPSFIGHTEFLQKLERKNYSNMILINKNIIVTPLTTHIKLKSVVNKITKDTIYNQIKNLNTVLKRDLNIKFPKIILSGLNPHAGENGKIGNEEKKIVNPSLIKLKKEKVLINGPVSADAMLLKENIKKYDCFVFMYHDQALIPFKFISQFTGVNFTGNLDVIRVSPDHGTAYRLKGKKFRSDKSIINCFKLVSKINNNRKLYEKSKKIIGTKLYN